eukprot:4627807-Pyramimonas_sp.AAC.1
MMDPNWYYKKSKRQGFRSAEDDAEKLGQERGLSAPSGGVGANPDRLETIQEIGRRGPAGDQRGACNRPTNQEMRVA